MIRDNSVPVTKSNASRALIIPLIFLLIGGMILISFFPHLKLALESSGWPTTRGVVLESRLIRKGRNSVEKRFKYTFKVDSVQYFGNTPFYGHGYAERKGSHKFASAYRVSKSVSVCYNPDDPNLSVIEPGLQLAALFVPTIGFVFFSAGLFFIYLIYKVVLSPSPVKKPLSCKKEKILAKKIPPGKRTVKFKVRDSVRGTSIIVPFGKIRRTPILILFCAVFAWVSIDSISLMNFRFDDLLFSLLFLIPVVVLVNVILVMVFGHWTVDVGRRYVVIRVGFFYLWWSAKIDLSSLDDIRLEKSDSLCLGGKHPDEIRIYSPEFEVQLSGVIRLFTKKPEKTLSKHGYFPFGGAMTQIQKEELYKLLEEKFLKHLMK